MTVFRLAKPKSVGTPIVKDVYNLETLSLPSEPYPPFESYRRQRGQNSSPSELDGSLLAGKCRLVGVNSVDPPIGANRCIAYPLIALIKKLVSLEPSQIELQIAVTGAPAQAVFFVPQSCMYRSVRVSPGAKRS